MLNWIIVALLATGCRNGNSQSSEGRNAAFQLGSCKIVLDNKCPDPDITFYLYTKNHPDTPVNIQVGNEWTRNLSDSDFDPKKPSKVIIHGYNSDMHLSVLEELRKEYLKAYDYNIITVDWSPLVMSPCYPGAVVNARHAGSCTAQMIQHLRREGAQDIHVIGFSLGAHVTNYMANDLRPYKVPRITGLDPALPGFITPNPDHKLDKTDAEFVDVYHTNAFMQGKVEESGHVDFYMNGGVVQPGCWAEPRFFACNHHRAPLYFAESINTEKGFWGWPCSNYFTYLLGRCLPKEPQILMGEHVSFAAKGVHLVITESVSPFAVGKYVGPSVEIIYKKSEHQRKSVLKKFKKQIMEYFEEDQLYESLLNDDRSVQGQLDILFADSLFSSN